MSDDIQFPTAWPHDEDGRPMAIAIGSVYEVVPTVQYGNVRVGPVTIMRPIKNGSRQEQINDTRRVQRDVEFVCGIERRSSQWALAGMEAKIVSPVPPEQAFGAPPSDYDHSSMEPHPADAANAPSADGVAKS